MCSSIKNGDLNRLNILEFRYGMGFFFFLEASQMIFISGPVVVSTGGVIKFQTQFTADQNYLNAKWLRCKRNQKKEITFENTKYFIYNSSKEIKTQTFEIVDLGEFGRILQDISCP